PRRRPAFPRPRGRCRHDLAGLAATPQTGAVHPRRPGRSRRADDAHGPGDAREVRKPRPGRLPGRARQRVADHADRGGFAVRPVLVGVFFGAPLVAREVEQGTHRLVWTQGVTRLQWALAKFGLVGAM